MIAQRLVIKATNHVRHVDQIGKIHSADLQTKTYISDDISDDLTIYVFVFLLILLSVNNLKQKRAVLGGLTTLSELAKFSSHLNI